MNDSPGRRPFAIVRQKLRSEVGFCCPVDGCGSPYLTWHHFDPPWRKEKHHRPEGMIALCREHADKADNGAFTDDQLRELKRIGAARALTVRGRLDWLRRDLLAVVGGNFYYEQEIIFQVGSVPCIWFERDEDGYLLLNVRMPTISGRPRARIEGNFWTVVPDVADVICPPGGRLVQIHYDNGDRFCVEFFTVAEPNELEARYPNRGIKGWVSRCTFPLTVVELSETAAGTSLEIGPTFTRLGGGVISDCFVTRSGRAGIMVEATEQQVTQLFSADDFE